MNDKFDQLRKAMQACQDDTAASPNEALLQFRNTANLGTLQELLAAHDRLSARLADVAAVHSVGVPNAGELDILSDYRKCDAQGKETIAISASVAAKISAEYADRPRCEVVEIGSKKPN